MGVLAHQGGWDEMLLVLGPIAVIVGLIVLVRKRVGAGVDLGPPEGGGGDGAGDEPPGATGSEGSSEARR